MVELGLLEEAKKWLYDSILMPESARGIGYKELFPYFARQSLDEALEKLKQIRVGC